MMRRFHEAEEEAEETEEALVVSKRSGKKKDDDDDDDFQQNNNNLLLLPCWRAVARKLRVASARDAQKEVLRRAGWETDERGFLIGEEEEEEEEECEQGKRNATTTRRREGIIAAAEEKDEEERSRTIDLTRADEEEDEEDEEDEDEPQPLAWRLLRKAVEKRCETRETLEEEEEDGDKTRPLSSPPDYSTKSEEELAKELEKFGMKRLGSRTAMIDCLMNIWIEKMVERGDGAAYSQRLEEELLSLSQRDQNVGTDESGEVKRKKRKYKHSSDLVGGKTTAREENDCEDERAFHAKLTSFLKSSRAVYATILRMEPIDLDKVKKLCEDGLRVKCISKVKLVSYFESKGVAMRHNTMKKKNARRHFSPIVEEELH